MYAMLCRPIFGEFCLHLVRHAHMLAARVCIMLVGVPRGHLPLNFHLEALLELLCGELRGRRHNLMHTVRFGILFRWGCSDVH